MEISSKEIQSSINNDLVGEIMIYSGVSGSGEHPVVIKKYIDQDTFLFEPDIEKNRQYYFYVETRQRKESRDKEPDHIWTSPIWYTWTD